MRLKAYERWLAERGWQYVHGDGEHRVYRHMLGPRLTVASKHGRVSQTQRELILQDLRRLERAGLIPGMEVA